jgi:hypothetical protein
MMAMLEAHLSTGKREFTNKAIRLHPVVEAAGVQRQPRNAVTAAAAEARRKTAAFEAGTRWTRSSYAARVRENKLGDGEDKLMIHRIYLDSADKARLVLPMWPT